MRGIPGVILLDPEGVFGFEMTFPETCPTLINAHNNTKYTPIKFATKGLVFFATPHYGGDGRLVTIGDVAYKIATSLGFQKGGDVLETLKRKSIFSDILHEQWRHQLEQYHIVSFWGTLDSVVPRRSARLNLPGDRENIVSLDADHSRICKFGLTQTDNDNFKLVRRNIRELYEKANESNKTNCKNIIPERISGTCAWFTGHSRFHDWRSSTKSSVLWASADPGCGKSVLARYLVDEVLPSTDTRTTSYFFFRGGLEEQRSMTVAMCCIVRQIINQRPNLLSKRIIEKFESRGTLTSSFQGLWEILIDLTKSQVGGEIICIMDAFDECDEEGRSQLIEALSKSRMLHIPGSHTGVLKFILTNRPDSTVWRGFQRLKEWIPIIEVTGESRADLISQEVKVFIGENLKNIGSRLELSESEQKLLRKQFTTVPHRTYLWANLVFKAIRDAVDITQDELQQYVRTLPRTVEEAYDKILCRSNNPTQAKRLLGILIAATRPLSLSEMAVALAIEESHQKHDDLLFEPEDRFRRTVRDLSGCFITVVESKIYLLHQTARDFLINTQNGQMSNAMIEPCLQWKHSVDIVESHRLLANACIWYLLLDPFETHHLCEDLSHNTHTYMICFLTLRSLGLFAVYPFLEYSAQNWVTHYQQAQFQKNGPVQNLIFRLMDSVETKVWYLIWASFHVECLQLYSPLTRASYFGLEEVVEQLCNQGNLDIESRDTDDNQTPLMWAAQRGHDGIVRLLLDRGASVNSDHLFDTPLIKAVKNKHSIVASTLLTRGANIEAADINGKTSLFYAATLGRGYKTLSYDGDLLRLLLRHGANVQARDITGKTPLSYAAEEGCDAVISVLLENGADPELKDSEGRTALSYAAEAGHHAVTQILLQQGADTSSKDNRGRPSLYYAIKWQHGSIARLLLDNITNVPPHDPYMELLWACTCWGEQSDIEKMVCEKFGYRSSSAQLARPQSREAWLANEIVKALILIIAGKMVCGL
ncbi:hypothetical protein Daesc_002223 [Daldinia eschscholtzii]|uniref:Uncharacterized protein n=1 Tax=Daldinia eschscholtzii TaxID=292717 RepID=A0AAX6MXL9_9PEZI